MKWLLSGWFENDPTEELTRHESSQHKHEHYKQNKYKKLKIIYDGFLNLQFFIECFFFFAHNSQY